MAKAASTVLKPKLTLTFYDHGVFLRTNNTEYAVDPLKVAQVLAANLPEEEFSTGLLGEDVLSVWQKGAKRVVVVYRRPQVTGIWLEGVESALHVPLPGLVMVRTTKSNRDPSYQIYAVKQRPGRTSKLYTPPLPNTSVGGTCWGTVQTPPAAALITCDLTLDWGAFLGSKFGNHSVDGKCVSERIDIRKLFMKLHEGKKKSYPRTELVEIRGKTFGQMLEEVCK
jgi:hypothetical protein